MNRASVIGIFFTIIASFANVSWSMNSPSENKVIEKKKSENKVKEKKKSENKVKEKNKFVGGVVKGQAESLSIEVRIGDKVETLLLIKTPDFFTLKEADIKRLPEKRIRTLLQQRINLQAKAVRACDNLRFHLPNDDLHIKLRKWLDNGGCCMGDYLLDPDFSFIIERYVDFDILKKVVKCAAAKEKIDKLKPGHWCLQDVLDPTEEYSEERLKKGIQIIKFVRGTKERNSEYLFVYIPGVGYRLPPTNDWAEVLSCKLDGQCSISLIEALWMLKRKPLNRYFRFKKYQPVPAAKIENINNTAEIKTQFKPNEIKTQFKPNEIKTQFKPNDSQINNNNSSFIKITINDVSPSVLNLIKYVGSSDSSKTDSSITDPSMVSLFMDDSITDPSMVSLLMEDSITESLIVDTARITPPLDDSNTGPQVTE